LRHKEQSQIVKGLQKKSAASDYFPALQSVYGYAQSKKEERMLFLFASS
jgi:hypothetical protein